jgi:hypothetical protein
MNTQTENEVLIAECKAWYEVLAGYREKINHMKSELYFFTPGKTDKDVQLGIEHFHNQFHIQLINLHDLKHEIKRHFVETEHEPNWGHKIPHRRLKEKMDQLLQILDDLDAEFHQFIKR